MDLMTFLFRNMKGYRLLFALAILITLAQVGADIATALPLKFIPSKVSNAGNDPACTFPFLNPILDRFDIPQIDPSLVDPVSGQTLPPSVPECPISPTDINAPSHPVLTAHTTPGVIFVPSYTFIALAVAPLLFVVILVYTRRIKAESKIAAKAAGQVADVATEDINALTVIKVFTREEREAVRFGGYVNKNRLSALKA